MHISTLLIPLLVAQLANAVVIVGKVNFYYDDNCQDYAGTEYPSPTEVSDPLTPGRGGPAGSHSIIWEYGELKENCMGPYFWACKNLECSAADGVYQGQCKSFMDGIWAVYQELCPN